MMETTRHDWQTQQLKHFTAARFNRISTMKLHLFVLYFILFYLKLPATFGSSQCHVISRLHNLQHLTVCKLKHLKKKNSSRKPIKSESSTLQVYCQIKWISKKSKIIYWHFMITAMERKLKFLPRAVCQVISILTDFLEGRVHNS